MTADSGASTCDYKMHLKTAPFVRTDAHHRITMFLLTVSRRNKIKISGIRIGYGHR